LDFPHGRLGADALVGRAGVALDFLERSVAGDGGDLVSGAAIPA
jgi:hypothetical protein